MLKLQDKQQTMDAPCLLHSPALCLSTTLKALLGWPVLGCTPTASRVSYFSPSEHTCVSLALLCCSFPLRRPLSPPDSWDPAQKHRPLPLSSHSYQPGVCAVRANATKFICCQLWWGSQIKAPAHSLPVQLQHSVVALLSWFWTFPCAQALIPHYQNI